MYYLEEFILSVSTHSATLTALVQMINEQLMFAFVSSNGNQLGDQTNNGGENISIPF